MEGILMEAQKAKDITPVQEKGIGTQKTGISAKEEKLCNICVQKGTCQAICPEVEAILPRPQGGCKNKIKHYTPDNLEYMANYSAFKYKGLAGRKLSTLEEE